jgi:hypothetical protein
MGWVRVPTVGHFYINIFPEINIMTVIGFIVPVLIVSVMWTIFSHMTRDVDALNELRARKFVWLGITFACMFLALQIINPVLHKISPAYFP